MRDTKDMNLYEEITYNIAKQNYSWEDILKITTTDPYVINFENEGVMVGIEQKFKKINLDYVSIKSIIMSIDMKDGSRFSLLDYDYGYRKPRQKQSFFQKIFKNNSTIEEIEFNNMVIIELENSYRYLKEDKIDDSVNKLKNALNLLVLQNNNLYKKI